MLTWFDGETPSSGADVDLATIVRRLHDLTADLAGPDECILHDDLQPRNVGLVGLIDWEQVRPGPLVEDLAGLCWSFTEPFDAAGRAALVPTMLARMDRCAADIERNAAAGSARHRVLLDRGDAAGIRAARAWVARHRDDLRT